MIIVGSTNDRIVANMAKKHNGVRKSEYRMSVMMFFSPLIAIGMFWYGWSVETKTHWFESHHCNFCWPGLFLFLELCRSEWGWWDSSYNFVDMRFLTKVTLVHLRYWGFWLLCRKRNRVFVNPPFGFLALTLRTFFRSILATFLPLAGPPLYNTLGLGFKSPTVQANNRWGNSVLGFIGVALIPIPFLLYRFVCFSMDADALGTVNGWGLFIRLS